MRVWRWGRASSEKSKKTFGIAHRELPSAQDIKFYERLNELLEAESSMSLWRSGGAKFYAAKYGRPSLTPGIYFRSLLLGFYEKVIKVRPT